MPDTSLTTPENSNSETTDWLSACAEPQELRGEDEQAGLDLEQDHEPERGRYDLGVTDERQPPLSAETRDGANSGIESPTWLLSALMFGGVVVAVGVAIAALVTLVRFLAMVF